MELWELFAALIPVAVLVLIILMVLRFENAKIEKIKQKLSSNELEKLQTSKFYLYEENNNFLVGTSYIYDINEDINRYEIYLIFCLDNVNEPVNGFMIDKIYMDKNKFKSMNLEVKQFVKTIHNKSSQSAYKVKEIMDKD